MKLRWFNTTFASFALLLACELPGLSHPQMFSDYSLQQAREAAHKQHKLLLIDFTASWCGPCKIMDDTTWNAAAVEEWIKNNAIAIQVDVDKEKHIASDFKISAMPTVIVFSADNQSKESDRQTGYKRPAELITWLDGVMAGKTSLAEVNEDARSSTGKGGRVEVQARYKLAEELLTRGQDAEATDQFVWLWNNILKEDPAMSGVRSSFMASAMRQLAERYAPAKTKFEELRNAAEKSDDRSDWMVLNGLLDDEAKSLSWFDEVKKMPDAQNKFEHVDFMLETLLIHDKRWADIGNYLYPDPIRQLHKQYAFSQTLQEFAKTHDTKGLLEQCDPFRKSAGVLYGALLSAGRTHKADELAGECLKLSDSMQLRCALAQAAFDVGHLGPDQMKLIEDVGAGTTKDVSFYRTRSHVFSEIKQPEKALKDADEVVKLDPTNVQSFYVRAHILNAAEKYEQAIADFSQAIKLDPNSATQFVERGYAYHKVDKDGLALADMQQALKVDPKNTFAYIDMSDIYFRQKKYQDAYDSATKAVELDPSDAYALANRGEAAVRLGKYEEAVADLTAGIGGLPGNYTAEACYFRAEAYEKLGKSDLAKADRETATKQGYKPD